MIRLFIVLLFLVFVQSCSVLSSGNNQKNLEQLDKVYGKCDNPHRQFSKQERIICRDKQRAAGPDGIVGEPFNLTEAIDKLKNGPQVVYSGTAVNDFLWNASLAVVDAYPLKTVDAQGGFISTDWILRKETPNQRCLVKINVTSRELISNGVNVKIICENLSDNNWYADGMVYTEEEKQLTLKILDAANQLFSQQPAS